MNFGKLDFGTKDAILAIAIFTILGVAVLFKWSAWEFVLSALAVGIAFVAGTMKQNKRMGRGK